ncbi:MAG TPA: alkaline phosphatase family protein [Stellaceae bacterium]|nr:alkaline phosphatase family protein [Stellaceae bacterium]
MRQSATSDKRAVRFGRALFAGWAMAAGMLLDGTPASAAPAKAEHVLLITIAGMHQVDLDRYVAANPASTLAQLVGRGTSYTAAQAPRPSDSFPGLIALVTGGLPKVTGVIYDDSFDRNLSPPGSDCGKRGGEAVFDEAIDVDDGKVDTAIDEAKLPRSAAAGCVPVYPHAYLRVNTVFDVAKAAGGRTAWGDKHPAYEILRGPSGTGLDELITPEIAAGKADGGVDKSIPNDTIRLNALLNQIAGKTAAGAPAVVPMVFGMNFESVSVGQKYSKGYLDAAGTPGPEITQALGYVDQSLGKIVAALDQASLTGSTAVIVTAKHGQSPIDPTKKRIVDGKLLPSIINGVSPGLLAHLTADDIGLIWLTDSGKTAAVVKALTTRKADLGAKSIMSGKQLAAEFGDPARDPRTPDIVIEVEPGVIYTKPTATKVAEHGGFSTDDRHVPIIVLLPGGKHAVVATPVETRSVAPTILTTLGLDPKKLDAVRLSDVKALPGLF